MIKFFRKIRQRLVNENRFSKYLLYAIGEIILVVIGILIALQINTWKLHNTNKDLERQYVNRLIEDLEEEKAIIQATLNYSNQVLNHAKKAVLIFENSNQNVENPVNSLINLYQASQIQNPASATSTYQELISSGQINLLENGELKTSLIRYYEYDWTNAVSVNLPNVYRANLRGKMPSRIQEEIRANCGDVYIKIRKTYEVTLPENCQISISDTTAKLIVQYLKMDVDLKKDLTVLIGNIEAKIHFINTIEMQLQDLINELNISKP